MTQAIKSIIRLPIECETIYVPGEIYVYRGRDDFAGGQATIDRVFVNDTLPENDPGRVFISIKERPGDNYNWSFVWVNQEKWAKEYGNDIAHPTPDDRPEFNDDNGGWERIH